MTALLSQERTDTLLRLLVKEISTKTGLGVTFVKDCNGAFGELGATYLTVRFRNADYHLITVEARVIKVSSSFENDEKARLERRD